VGGGAVGCSIAYQLSQRGVATILLERAELGSQSTGRCAGGVRQQFSTEVNVQIQLESVRMLKVFEDEVGGPCGFRQIGYLFALTSNQQVQDFDRLIKMWHRLGLKDANWLSVDDAARISPALNVTDVVACTYCPSDGLASPTDVTQSYAQAARRYGARLHEGVEVTAISAVNDQIVGVQTTAGPISTSAVFICAGAWSAQVGHMVGVELPVLPFRRQIFVTDHVPEVPPTSPMTIDFGNSLYFHPEGDGVLFGITDPEEPSSFNTDTDWSLLERFASVISHRVPALERAGIRTAWAGLYEVSPDNQAILGAVEEVNGLWCACGFSGHGFMQASAVGKLIAQSFVGEPAMIDLTPLAPNRFNAGGSVPELNVI
jgi:sarcosine oxidase subunit beta